MHEPWTVGNALPPFMTQLSVSNASLKIVRRMFRERGHHLAVDPDPTIGQAIRLD